MDANWLWLLPFGLWGFLEWKARHPGDRLQYNTYWIRKAPWIARAFAVLGLSAFLIQHFLFCGEAC